VQLLLHNNSYDHRLRGKKILEEIRSFCCFSPMVDDNMHPMLTPTTSVISLSPTHTLNRMSSDESGLSSRFFLFKKDSERRNTLASFMDEYKVEVRNMQICIKLRYNFRLSIHGLIILVKLKQLNVVLLRKC
jgi:hypothetical protein